MRNKLDYVKLVSSFVLGDGCLNGIHPEDGTSRHGKTKNSRYSLTQIAVHRDYVEWQADILSNLTSVTITEKEAYADANSGNHQKRLQLRTKKLPFYTTLYHRWYNNGKKVLSVHDLKLLDWQMAAILYMDDGNLGSRNRQDGTTYNRITLCTDSFSEADNMLLRSAFIEKLGIHFTIQKVKGRNNFYYRLRTSKDQADRFLEGVSSHILPSFQYKLARLTPTDMSDDDIVCSAW